ncbi:cytochrome P450 [Microtetraspora sp. AC03309]|uniref:cytochrome P450 n=1 Tax=Microtetraspora sp. AC03309 TaxID=2779376 RepID=UPI001E30E3B1|nr:cytochrome P450 [Microtetraspora sp. AC03309]MCC5580170.1 cytochrome P450 [Microtetraspora sp. AC03309]
MTSPSELTPITAVTAADPYPWYADLVRNRPFGWDEGLGMWVAASAEAVTAVLGEPALRVRPPAEPVPAGIVGTPAGDVFGHLVRMTDGPAQQRYKRAVRAALGHPRTEEITGLAAERTSRALKHSGPPPLRELMFSVPARVVAGLCGLDDEAADEAGRLIADFVQCIPASATPEQQAAAARAAAALQGLLTPYLDEHGTGVLGELIRAARRDGSPAIAHEDVAPLLANGVGLLSQTYDATAGLIGNTLVALATGVAEAPREPGRWRALAREVARFDAPVQNTRRFAAAPVTVAGAEVPEGASVLVVLAAANRDPAANAAPDEFRDDRSDAAIFTFGAAAHRCPGEEVAVAIAAAVVAELLAQGFDPASLRRPVSYLPLANARIPVL